MVYDKLSPGWYLVGFADDHGRVDWCNTTYAKFTGTDFIDEEGDEIEGFWDPFHGIYVPGLDADIFIPQTIH